MTYWAAFSTVLLGMSLLRAPAAHAAWYVVWAGGDRIDHCDYWNESIDQSWEKLNRQFKTHCEFVTEGGAAVSGFIFKCSPDNNQMFFRSIDDCENAKIRSKTGASANLPKMAPPGIKNPNAWVFALDGCMTRLATPATIKKTGLQPLSNYCGCVAEESGKYTDPELTAAVTDRLAEGCENQLGTRVSAADRKRLKLLYLTPTPIASSIPAFVKKFGE
jgi:hypothetical protein